MASQMTMIAIQDEYISKVLTCTSGHLLRVRRGARNAAFAKLDAIGYTIEQRRQIVADAEDIAKLERDAITE